MSYSIEKIATLIGARQYGKQAAQINLLLTDSRSLSFPESTLFFAIPTHRDDGHKYIPDLYERGVRNFVIERLPVNYEADFPKANFLRVPNTRKALQRLAERHRDEFTIPVIGITGSNGKTVVKEWLFQILSAGGNGVPAKTVVRSPRSYNSQIGVPLSVWQLTPAADIAIFEAGISKPGEMQPLRDIIQPTIGVLTNIGSAHQENFSTLEAKCMEKMQLFKEADIIIIPQDCTVADSCIQQMRLKAKVVRWSRADADRFKIPFSDEASINNACVCYATLKALGMNEDAIRERLKELEPVALRMEVKEGKRGLTLINDSYNSDVVSLDIALSFMARRKDIDGRRKTVILSDILQTGKQPEELYCEVSEIAKARGIDRLIGIGEDICAQKDRIEISDKHFFDTTDDFLRSDLFKSLEGDIILIKGARRYRFDRISDQLELKVHETILEVNLSALVKNLDFYRLQMKPSTKLVAMVKADAYGAGAVEVAKVLQDHHIDYLAVAVADEGAELRKAGITANIMIMNPEMTAFKTIFDNRLEPEVYNFRLLNALIKAARMHGITNYPVHIKLDTGMHRLGFETQDIPQLIDTLKGQSELLPRSVFSHFVGADDDQFDEFSKQQFNIFQKNSDDLQAAFQHKILRHIDNSAGILHFPEHQLDMCRLGIGLYGVNNRDNSIINNVSTLKTTILQIRNVPKGETIGYSRKGILQRDSRIAAIPIGYADGLNRHLGNRHAYCLVNGEKAPYVGNICMDVAMIDVTGIQCKEGDSVEIFGDNLPVTILSDALETIPYEILTSVSNRVKKIYFQD